MSRPYAQSLKTTKTGIRSARPSLLEFLKSIDRAWLLTWALLYFSFLTLDALFPNFWGATLLKYTGIALCFVYGITNFPNDHLLVIALGLTLLSDTLLMLDNLSLFGLISFCFAQFFHTARFRRTAPGFLGFYFIFLILLLTFGLAQGFEPLVIVGFLYGITLINNVFLALGWAKRDPKSIFARNAAIGFALFLCCDTCVLTSYLSLTAILPAILYPFANYFAWFFYYPSQIFISNSSTYLADHQTNHRTANTK